MATSTDFLHLVKAAFGEKYDVDITNTNLDDIDAGIKALSLLDAQITFDNSTYNAGAVDATSSTFTKITLGKMVLVIAEFRLNLKTSLALPAGGNQGSGGAASFTNIPCTPAGYERRSSGTSTLALASGSGRGDKIQVFSSAGVGFAGLGLRAYDNTAFTLAAATNVTLDVAYRGIDLP